MKRRFFICILLMILFITCSTCIYHVYGYTGWKTINGKTYYYNTEGKKVTGWNTIDGDKFYMKSDGSISTKWTTIDNNKYYFRSKDTADHKAGSMLTGKRTLSGVVYIFNDNGVLLGSTSATVSPKNVTGKDGYTQTVTLSGKTYKLFKQGQGTWATQNYYSCSNSADKVAQYTYKNTGCGPCALATIISGYNSSTTPLTVGKQCLKNSIPSSLPSLQKVATSSGFKTKVHYYSSNYTTSYNEMKNALIANHKIVLYVGKSAPQENWDMFTKSGYHFISILEIDKSNEKVFVGNSAGNCESGWYDLSTVVKARGDSNSNNKMNGWLEVYK